MILAIIFDNIVNLKSKINSQYHFCSNIFKKEIYFERFFLFNVM